LTSRCCLQADVPSRNCVMELRGHEKPDEASTTLSLVPARLTLLQLRWLIGHPDALVLLLCCKQIVVVGAHLDSWDVGQGAHDDGQGCMVAWECVRFLKELGILHTFLRCVQLCACWRAFSIAAWRRPRSPPSLLGCSPACI
jgi:hypothetical protein